MFLDVLLYAVGFFVFKFYAELLFNYDRTFDKKLPERVIYDFIIGNSVISFMKSLFQLILFDP